MAFQMSWHEVRRNENGKAQEVTLPVGSQFINVTQNGLQLRLHVLFDCEVKEKEKVNIYVFGQGILFDPVSLGVESMDELTYLATVRNDDSSVYHVFFKNKV